MENYPTNPSQPQLPQGKKTIAKSKAVEVKKSFMSRLFDSMVVEDWPTIKKYLVGRVILPGINRLINDIFSNAINVAFNGVKSRPTTSYSDGQTNYNAISTPVRVIGTSNMVQPYKDPEVTKRYSFKLLAYETQEDAIDVLEQLKDDIDRYGMATLLHYYEYSDVETESTENNWGWKNLDRAEVYMDISSHAWIIKLPKVQPLD